MVSELHSISQKYQTDKSAHQHYLQNYETYFAPLRDADVKLLELGIKDGGSLLLWRDYFPKGTIVGLDINPAEVNDPTGRIRTYQGAQEDSTILKKLAAENAPVGFDFIIDDCAHIGVLARASFWYLFENHLKSGGVYFIEDWGTGYWREWVDGVPLRPKRKELSWNLYKLTRALSRIEHTGVVRKFPPARALASRLKAAVLAPQFRRHDYGMVGFVKELVDEIGIEDITNPRMGIGKYKQSKFRSMHITKSHVAIVKQ